METTFYSNGKLLISGEYVVLDGATALAIPTKFGQTLRVKPKDDPSIVWESYSNEQKLWFKARMAKGKDGLLKSLSTGEIDKPTETLLNILNTCIALNGDFLASSEGYNVTTHLDFSNDWGLGTSSTLINNIAQWAQVDAFQLLHRSFGGSGYDIACAQHNEPILYSIDAQKQPHIVPAAIEWPFSESLYFVYLGQKMDSKKGIAHYRNQSDANQEIVSAIGKISKRLVECTTLEDFEALLNQHEQLLSRHLQLPTVKKRLFNNYPRAIKSLGAWGGDFVLVVASDTTIDYFKEKGYQTIVSFDQMLLQ
ncbi:MAG: GYDIA family GHMP kinase [Gilvibacter sp.]